MSWSARVMGAAEAVVPERVRRWIRGKQREHRLQWPRSGTVDFGDLRRLSPVSRVFGLDRGLPIDRYYIEQFLAANSKDIRGRVLEMGDATYTRKFGGAQVEESDVLHVVAGNPQATIIADLTSADSISSDSFDCIILTQTLQMIFDAPAALRNVHRILKPGGVLLMTTHGISRVARREGVDDWGEYWHFTSQGLKRLFGLIFGASDVTIAACGNVLAAVASLHGLAAEELTREELDTADPNFELLLTVRAMKGGD